MFISNILHLSAEFKALIINFIESNTHDDGQWINWKMLKISKLFHVFRSAAYVLIHSATSTNKLYIKRNLYFCFFFSFLCHSYHHLNFMHSHQIHWFELILWTNVLSLANFTLQVLSWLAVIVEPLSSRVVPTENFCGASKSLKMEIIAWIVTIIVVGLILLLIR